MCNDLYAVEKLIEDFRPIFVMEGYAIEDSVIKIRTSTFLLLIYLPQSNRLAINEDIKVIHLDIDVLNNSYQKVLQRIIGLLGAGKRIYARQTVVARVDKKVALDFLEENHLNIPLAGKYRYGLFYQGELVSIAVFSGARIMHAIAENYRSFELLRFCHKSNYLVIGGISKLIKAFVKEFSPHDIMTYADRDWSQVSSLENIGFKAESITREQVFYVRNGKRLVNIASADPYDYCIKNKGSIKLKLYL